MRIVIDLQGIQTESRFNGIGRYCLAITQAIVRMCIEHEIIIALNGLFPETIEPILATFEGILPQKNIRIWCAPGPVRVCDPNNESRYEAAELLREVFLASLNPDVIFITSFFEGYGDDAVTSIGACACNIPTVVMLYDSASLSCREKSLEHDPSYEQYYCKKLEYLKKANCYFVITTASAQAAINTLGISQNLITNIATAHSVIATIRPVIASEAKQSSIKNDLLQKFNINRPFILYCSGVDFTNNLPSIPNLLLAYSKLPLNIKSTYQLMIIGAIPIEDINELHKIANSLGIRTNELVFTGHITNEELTQLYNLCKLFILSSSTATHSVIASEAKQSSNNITRDILDCCANNARNDEISVVKSEVISITEVVGIDDTLFDPFDSSDIAAKITNALTEYDASHSFNERAIIQTSKLSLDVAAQQAINAFERLYLSLKSAKKSPTESIDLSAISDAIANIKPLLSTEDLANSLLLLTDNFVPSSRRKRLFLDISSLVQQDFKTGIERTVRALLQELLFNSPAEWIVEPVYATSSVEGYRYARRFTSKLLDTKEEWNEDELVDARPGDIFLGLDLIQSCVIAQKNFLLAWRNRGIKIFFVVYDLLPITFPQYFPRGISAWHQLWLECISNFDGAICISNSVAKELKTWCENHNPRQLRQCRIDWFHLGADIENSVASTGMPGGSNLVIKQITHYPTFVMVGTVEPRKGHAQTIKAFEQLWRDGCDISLVIVGRQGWMADEFFDRLRCHSELNKHLFWLEGISDEYLEKIYAASVCLIAASEGEGFGLPLIEAAKHKLPIIARDIPVFRELAGGYAFYFNGKEPDDLANAIKNWLILYSKKQHPCSGDMPWLTWKESAKSLINKIRLEKK